jgi:hypothetical protein
VDLPSPQNGEARPTTLRKNHTLAIKNTGFSKPTQSTYTQKKIIIEANTTAGPIGQTQSILFSLLFMQTIIPNLAQDRTRTGTPADHRSGADHGQPRPYLGLGSRPLSRAQWVPTVRTWGLRSTASPGPGPYPLLPRLRGSQESGSIGTPRDTGRQDFPMGPRPGYK